MNYNAAKFWSDEYETFTNWAKVQTQKERSYVVNKLLTKHFPNELKEIKRLQRTGDKEKQKEAEKIRQECLKKILGPKWKDKLNSAKERQKYLPPRMVEIRRSFYRTKRIALEELYKAEVPPEVQAIGDWLSNFKGISSKEGKRLATLVCLNRSWTSPSALEKWAGLWVDKRGKAVRKLKGVQANFPMKQVFYFTAQNLKMKRDPIAEQIYSEAKEDYLKKYPNTQNRYADYHAKRIIAKRLLSWMFQLWWYYTKTKQEGIKIPRPMHVPNVPLEDEEIEPPPFTEITLKDFMSKEETVDYYSKM